MAKRPPSRPPVTPPVRSPHMQEIAQGYSPNTTAKGAVAPGHSSLDSRPGTLSGMDAKAAGQAAQVLQESKNQMRDAKMSPAEISYALANQNVHILATATPKYEITGSPAFNAKLQQAQMPVPNVQNVAPEMNSNLPPLFGNTAGPATLSPPNPINSVAGQATQPGLVQQGLDKVLGAFGQGYSDIGGGVNVADIAMMGAAGSIIGKGLGLVKVGTMGIPKGVVGTASKIASNTKTQKLTATWLTKVLTTLGKPQVVAGVLAASLVPIIGSYPFSGFIKEEALQTTSMAFNSAYQNHDTEGMKNALLLNAEILDPKTEEGIKNNIPFKNVLDKLEEYWKAARLQGAVQKKVFENVQTGVITANSDGTTNVDWDKVRQEKAAQEKASVDYYNSERLRVEKEILQLRADAQRQQSAEWSAAQKANAEATAKFWADYQKGLEEMKRKEMEEQAAFWLEYKKLVMKMNEESRGSSLNFGLLR